MTVEMSKMYAFKSKVVIVYIAKQSCGVGANKMYFLGMNEKKKSDQCCEDEKVCLKLAMQEIFVKKFINVMIFRVIDVNCRGNCTDYLEKQNQLQALPCNTIFIKNVFTWIDGK